MDFFECLREAVKAGTLSQNKLEDYEKVYEVVLNNEAKNPARPTQVELDKAAMLTVGYFSHKTPAENWRRVNAIRSSAELYKKVNESNAPHKELQTLATRMEEVSRRIHRDAIRVGARFMVEMSPTWAGLKRPIQRMEDIVFASFGRKTDPAASTLLDSYDEIMRYLEDRANSVGASIPKRESRKIGLFQSRQKLRDITKKYYKEELPRFKKQGLDAKEADLKAHEAATKRGLMEWRAFNAEHIDWKEQGRILNLPLDEMPSLREKWLSQTYRTIHSEGNILKKPGTTFAESLAGRISRDTKIYYKTPEAYLEAQKRWGNGDLLSQVVSDIALLARDVALMEVLGPNPPLMIQMVENVARKRAAEIDLKRAKGRSELSRVERDTGVLNSAYKIHASLVNMGEESPGANTLAVTHSIATMGVLGGAAIANSTDFAFGAWSRLFNKMGVTHYIKQTMDEIFSLPSKDRKIALMQIDGVGEGMIAQAMPYQRYVGEFHGPQWSRLGMDVFMRGTGMNGITHATQRVHSQDLYWSWARYANKELDEFPLAEDMKRQGITKEDWDEFRRTPFTTTVDGKEVSWLTPVSVLKRNDLDPSYAMRLKDKFDDYVLSMERIAVPHTDLRTQVQLGGAVDRDILAGGVQQIFRSVKGFTMSIMMNQLRMIMDQPTLRGKLWAGASFVVVLTVAGAIITQAKEMLLYGREPADMTKPAFWLRAALNGGSLGFIGDALLSNVNQYRGGGISEAFGGPVIEFINNARNLTWGNIVELAQGQKTKFGREFVEFAQRYAPIPWQTQLLLDRLLIERLLIAVDPTAYARLRQQERRRETELNQGHWWRPGALTPGGTPVR